LDQYYTDKLSVIVLLHTNLWERSKEVRINSRRDMWTRKFHRSKMKQREFFLLLIKIEIEFLECASLSTFSSISRINLEQWITFEKVNVIKNRQIVLDVSMWCCHNFFNRLFFFAFLNWHNSLIIVGDEWQEVCMMKNVLRKRKTNVS
jgi:hypothetical protein